MKKAIIALALVLSLFVGFVSTAAACGTNMVYEVYKFVPVGGQTYNNNTAMGGQYVGTYYNANHVLSYIQSAGVDGWVTAFDRTCGGLTFYQYNRNGNWWLVG